MAALCDGVKVFIRKHFLQPRVMRWLAGFPGRSAIACGLVEIRAQACSGRCADHKKNGKGRKAFKGVGVVAHGDLLQDG